MDFALPHLKKDGVAVKSKIRVLPRSYFSSQNGHIASNSSSVSVPNLDASHVTTTDACCTYGSLSPSLNDKLLLAANQAARDLFYPNQKKASLGWNVKSKSKDTTHTNTETSTKVSTTVMTETEKNDSRTPDDCYYINAGHYPERILPTTSTIEPGALVVIFESFDNLNFVYATPGEQFRNRNGCFPHDDFIGKPFGSIVRSKDHQGYGFVYLFKPTPELWARSLTHRTQIVHELDASMICFYLELRPNSVVVEAGTGSGALSHAMLRSIAPHGKLYTFEFHQDRAIKARQEFHKNGVSHLVQVTHRDVCGKNDNNNTNTNTNNGISNNQSAGGFGLGGRRAHAVMLDLPEPWLAVPHAAYVLKMGGRIASYSPCVEQAQRCVASLHQSGFHSVRTLEFRLREHYVDEVDLWSPPSEKRPRLELNEQQLNSSNSKTMDENCGKTLEDGSTTTTENYKSEQREPRVARKLICTRPFNNMRGHTAFLTFATAGNTLRPDPCSHDCNDNVTQQ